MHYFIFYRTKAALQVHLILGCEASAKLTLIRLHAALHLYAESKRDTLTYIVQCTGRTLIAYSASSLNGCGTGP